MCLQKKCVFGYGYENSALHKQWMQFVFPGQQLSFASVFVDEHQFDTGFAHHMILNVRVLLTVGAQVLVTI